MIVALLRESVIQDQRGPEVVLCGSFSICCHVNSARVAGDPRATHVRADLGARVMDCALYKSKLLESLKQKSVVA
jgi:hypothetical protein